jgi:hypothetical protein
VIQNEYKTGCKKDTNFRFIDGYVRKEEPVKKPDEDEPLKEPKEEDSEPKEANNSD